MVSPACWIKATISFLSVERKQSEAPHMNKVYCELSSAVKKSDWLIISTPRIYSRRSRTHPRRVRRLMRSREDRFFDEIIGYEHIKRLFGLALTSHEPIHVLLSGPPASAKTMLLMSLREHLKDSHFID